MPRNGPDELESRQQRWQSLLDQLKVALLDVTELPVERRQELHEVPGLGLLLDELAILVVEVIKSRALVALLLSVLQDLLDPLDPIEIELLEQGVEGGTTLSPVLSLARRRGLVWLPLALSLQRLLDRQRPLFLFENVRLDIEGSQ